MTATNHSAPTSKPADPQSRLAGYRCFRWTAEQLRMMAEMEAEDPTCGLGSPDTPKRRSTHTTEAANGR